jgi:hypothetical protein
LIRQHFNRDVKKPVVSVPPTELTFVLSFSKESDTELRNKKRVFFVVHADCEADQATRLANSGLEFAEICGKV